MSKILYIVICLIILGSVSLYLYMSKDDQLEMMDAAVKGSYVYVSPVPNTPQSTEPAQMRLQKQINNLDESLNKANQNGFSVDDLNNDKMGI